MKIFFNHKEELWNSWSHAAGIVMGVAAGAVFLAWCMHTDNIWATTGVILYLFGMLCSYAASTVYHSLSAWSKWKERLRRWDHAAIYWHIAGSYSPITLIALRECGAWGWSLFAFIWTAAIAGTIMSFARLKDHSNIETACFVAMGMSVLVAFGPLSRSKKGNDKGGEDAFLPEGFMERIPRLKSLDGTSYAEGCTGVDEEGGRSRQRLGKRRSALVHKHDAAAEEDRILTSFGAGAEAERVCMQADKGDSAQEKGEKDARREGERDGDEMLYDLSARAHQRCRERREGKAQRVERLPEGGKHEGCKEEKERQKDR